MKFDMKQFSSAFSLPLNSTWTWSIFISNVNRNKPPPCFLEYFLAYFILLLNDFFQILWIYFCINNQFSQIKLDQFILGVFHLNINFIMVAWFVNFERDLSGNISPWNGNRQQQFSYFCSEMDWFNLITIYIQKYQAVTFVRRMVCNTKPIVKI